MCEQQLSQLLGSAMASHRCWVWPVLSPLLGSSSALDAVGFGVSSWVQPLWSSAAVIRSSAVHHRVPVQTAALASSALPVVWCVKTVVVHVAGATGTVLLACGAPRLASCVARPLV